MTGVPSDDLSEESPSSSGSSWWKKLFPSKGMTSEIGASHEPKVGSLFDKIGLGALFKLFRRRHTATTIIVDESGHVIGELTTTTTDTQHDKMTTISPQHGGTTTTTISPQHGSVTTTTISSQPGGVTTTTSSQSGGATTTMSSQHGGATAITSQRGGITTTSSQRGGLKGSQRIIYKDGGSETQTIITEERKQGEGTEGDEEVVEQRITEYVEEVEVEEEEKKNDK